MSRSPRQRVTQAMRLLSLNLLIVASAYAQVDTTALTRYQRATDLRSPLTVLTIAMRPGEEDLQTLAYLRMALGARVMSLYVTNGESGENELFWEYPPFLAARRREAAADAMRSLEAEAYFLGMPDILPADTSRPGLRWSVDTLEVRLQRVITQFRPDVIVMFDDREAGPRSPMEESLKATLLRTVTMVADQTPALAAAARERFDKWTVLRVFEEGKGPLTFPVSRKHPVLQKSYAAIGAELGNQYAFMAARRARWTREGSFARLVPVQGKDDRNLDPGRLGLVPRKYAGISAQLSAIAGGMLAPGTRRPVLVRQLVAALDSIEQAMRHVLEVTHRDRRLLTQWKSRLEDARVAVMGIRVQYVLTENVLSDQQLTFFRIDTVTNIPAGGTTELYVPAAMSGWGVDENVNPWLPFEMHREYRFLSPPGLPKDTPQWENGLSKFGVGYPFLVAMVHRGKTREENFMYRITLRFSYAPRFTTEFLTPIVRVLPQESIVIRLTNHTRDGVADRLVAGDSVVFRPDTAVFGLPFKESSVTDTMTLHGFSDRLADGNYLVPVKIGPITVGEFGARHFRADIDTTRRVVVVSGKMNPPVRQTLQRMGIASRVIQRDEDLGRIDTAPCDVVVIDRNALVTVPALRGAKDPLRRFMGGGGKVVILAQDADVWASAPLVDGLSLTDTLAGRMIAQLRPDTTQYPFSGPNTIGTELTMGWTSRMFYNAVSSTMSAVRLTGPAGALIITGTEGKGGWTYVDLALDPQWMNVDPSAFRLLANIVSAR